MTSKLCIFSFYVFYVFFSFMFLLCFLCFFFTFLCFFYVFYFFVFFIFFTFLWSTRVFLCVCVSVCVCVCVCVEEPAPRHSRHLCIQDAAAAAYRMLLLLSFAYRTADICVEEPSQFILLLRLYEPALHAIKRMLLLSCGHYAPEIHCN